MHKPRNGRERVKENEVREGLSRVNKIEILVSGDGNWTAECVSAQARRIDVEW